MILGQATNATLETQNPGNAREHKTILTKKHETHPAAARVSHHAASSSLNPTQVVNVAELEDRFIAEDCCEKKPNHIHDIRKTPVCGTLLP